MNLKEAKNSNTNDRNMLNNQAKTTIAIKGRIQAGNEGYRRRVTG